MDNKGGEEKEKMGWFSAEEEKEPSFCPEKTALLSRAECPGVTKKLTQEMKAGPRVGGA